MIPEDIDFPLFRRTADEKHFYRIEALDRFTEIQRIGSRAVLHHVHASKYPERSRVQEMIQGEGGLYLELTHEQWDVIVRHHGLVP